MKQLLELGPLLLFFAVYYFSDPESAFFTATAVLVVTSVIALGLSRAMYGKVPMMPLVSTALVVVFGGLTLFLQDKTFLKMKPTIVYAIFAATLMIGLYLKKPLIKYIIGQAIQMSDTGWNVLTVRWIGFFIGMALLNELIWRNFSEGVWVNFKVFGALPLTVLFGLCQIPLMQRHGFQLPDDAKK
ncbi:MAG: septation protein A [Hyphomicrobiaceae bacterium]